MEILYVIKATCKISEEKIGVLIRGGDTLNNYTEKSKTGSMPHTKPSTNSKWIRDLSKQ